MLHREQFTLLAVLVMPQVYIDSIIITPIAEHIFNHFGPRRPDLDANRQ